MNMKKVVVLMCVAWMGAGAFALSFLGPPTAELEKTTRRNEQGKEVSRWEDRWGYVYSFSKTDIGIDGVGVAKDTELTRHYLTWGVALDENFNFNVLLGTASGEMDNSDLGSTSDSNIFMDNFPGPSSPVRGISNFFTKARSFSASPRSGSSSSVKVSMASDNVIRDQGESRFI